MQAAIRRVAWACIFVLAIGNAAAAQDVITISGTVTTRADGLSVSGAMVSVIGTTINATTDASGGTPSMSLARLRAAVGFKSKWTHSGLPSKVTDVEVSSTALTVDVALSLAFAEQVTVGSRAVGAEAQKAVPVDVITQDQIASTGYAETAQVIQALAPVVQLPAADDHRRHRHGASRDAARPRARPGAGARQRQAAPPERAGAPQRQHRPRLDRRRSERDPGLGHRAHRSAARRRRGAVRLGRHRRRHQHRAQGRRVAADGHVEVRAVQGIVRRQQLRAERADVFGGSDIDFSDGGLFDAGDPGGSPPARAA